MIAHYKSVDELKQLINYSWTKEANNSKAKLMLNKTATTKTHGMDSAQSCIDALSKGYPAGLKQVHDTLSNLSNLPRAIGIARTLTRGAMGDELDIHAVNRGAISTAWTSRKRLIRKTTANIRIVVDICGNAGVSSERLLWRGVAGLALSNILSKAKYKTEIVAAIAVSSHYDTSKTDCIGITVKPFGVKADEGLLSATLCLSGFFRTLGLLAIIKQADDAGYVVDDGIGHSVSAEHFYPTSKATYQIVIPSFIDSKASCQQWLTATIKLIGANK
jgi:hypothetical protein